MNNLLVQTINEQWYQSLVEDCKAIVTEAVFSSRWALVEGYWNLGKRIREENNLNREDAYGEKIVQGLANSLSVSTRTIHYSLQAYDKYPQIETLPEGKNITWNKLVTKYLPKTEKKEDQTRCDHRWLCSKCGGRR